MNHRLLLSALTLLPLSMGCGSRPAATVVTERDDRTTALVENVFPQLKQHNQPLGPAAPDVGNLPPDMASGKFDDMPKPEFGDKMPSDIPPAHVAMPSGSPSSNGLPGTIIPPMAANPMGLPGAPMTGHHPGPAMPVTPGVGPNLAGAPPHGAMPSTGPQHTLNPAPPPTFPALPPITVETR